MATLSPPVTIKAYGNQRLYNPGTGSYVSLDDLAAMVEGVDAVLDVLRGRAAPPVVTGEDRNFEPVLRRVRAAHAPYWAI